MFLQLGIGFGIFLNLWHFIGLLLTSDDFEP